MADLNRLKIPLLAAWTVALGLTGAAACSAASGGGGTALGSGGTATEAGSGGSASSTGGWSGTASDAGIDVALSDSGGPGCPGCTPCEAAAANKESVGCDYYAVQMDAMSSGFGGCFVSFVANTGKDPVHIEVEYAKQKLDVSSFARIPQGSGATLSYAPYDAAAGLAAGQVAILFLAHDSTKAPSGNVLADPVQCPVTPAVSDGSAQFHNSNFGNAFHVTTDLPVVAYQMLPFGGGNAAVTGATLLIPTSAWGTNYVAVEAYKSTKLFSMPPSMNIVAMEDDTVVTMLPNGEIKGYGNIVPQAQPNTTFQVKLDKGQHLQLTEQAEYTGSPIVSNKPIGLFGGHVCMDIPYDTDWCDHAEQQIPAISALGNEYAAVGYKDRKPGVAEKRMWRIVGVVDGTALSFDPPSVTAEKSVGLGQIIEIVTDTPFVVKSQDAAHPFMLYGYMSGALNLDDHIGDPDFVRGVPSQQFLKKYVFFTDPTYPETSLVVVRHKGKSGFGPVTLGCAGELGGWAPLGPDHEYTRVDLVKGNFEPVGSCDNGRQEMQSDEPFGVWVWGWGSTATSGGDCWGKGVHTCDVSYAYPAGENLTPINDVVVIPQPK